MAWALREPGGFESRSDTIGLQFLLAAEVIYSPKQEESQRSVGAGAGLAGWEAGPRGRPRSWLQLLRQVGSQAASQRQG